MTSDKLHEIMNDLSKARPIFHSEADFQHALAWMIHEIYPNFEVRLEKREIVDGKEIYFDIFVLAASDAFPIEVKYKTGKLKMTIPTDRGYKEEYDLKNQVAHDVARYNFIKDILRIEKFRRGGFAVFLTNDKSYWEESSYKGLDDAFKIHEGRKISGTLNWKEGTGAGTIKGKEEPITLRKKYTLHWRDYAELKTDSASQQRNTRFRYLLIEVQK